MYWKGLPEYTLIVGSDLKAPVESDRGGKVNEICPRYVVGD